MSPPRLSAATADQLPAHVRRPDYDRTACVPSLVHIGVGAFHRGHQAVYTDLANGGSARPTGITGISLRSSTAEGALSPQDGLYTACSKDSEAAHYRLMGCLHQIITATDGTAAAIAALAAPPVSTVTLTITEKGYGLDPASGDLVTGDGEIAADLADPAHPRSAIGVLVAALAQRREAGRAPLTLMSCDNLPDNGGRLRRAVIQYADYIDPTLATWIERVCAFPATMVDRIVPATTAADVARATTDLGLVDEGVIVTEPFRQWVVEDQFAGPRPPWEAAGALLVPNVEPYEVAKLRLLNGPHSAIAYLGGLAGHTFVHEVMGDPILARYIEELMEAHLAPTVTAPPGLDLEVYTDSLRQRFANATLGHRTAQIANDGSQKLPQRLLNPLRDRLAADAPIGHLALAVAGWIVYTADRDAIDDPKAAWFAAMATRAGSDVEALVDGYLSLGDVFGSDLPQARALRGALIDHVKTLRRDGVHGALTRLFASG